MKPINYKHVAAAIHSWYGIELTESQVKAVLKNEPALGDDIYDMGIDTSNREWFIDSLSKYVGVKGPWPLNGDSQDYKRDHASDFYKLGKAKGLKFRDGWLDAMLK